MTEQKFWAPNMKRAGLEFAIGSVLIAGVRSAGNGALESLVPWFADKEFDDTLFNLAGWLAWGLLAWHVISHARKG